MARIAIGGFQHETNTFAPSRAGYEAFEKTGAWPPITSGEALFEVMSGLNVSCAGFIETARGDGHELVATTWAAAAPSDVVTRGAYETIAGRIVDGIRDAHAKARLDAVYLCLHGAMVAEHLEDGEGELLGRVRSVVGPSVPVVASLDSHSNTTPEMIGRSDALVAYRTYPHIDMAATGARVGRLLGRMLAERRGVHQWYRQMPFLIPLSWQCTMAEPAASIYADLEAIEREYPGVVLSFTPGFPAADIHHCGAAVFGVGDDSMAVDEAVAQLARRVGRAEADFAGKIWQPEEGVREAMRLAQGADRPVIIADTQDNPGAGGESNTTGMLRALLACRAENAALGVMVDPANAEIAHRAGVGAEITVPLGANPGYVGDEPLEATFRVAAVHDGRFDATGPFYANAKMRLGPSARLEIGGVQIVLASVKAQMADQAMYRYVGIEPTEKAILVNKSSVHFRADFTPIAHEILICAAPGPMVADPANLDWKRLRRGVRLTPLGPEFQG